MNLNEIRDKAEKIGISKKAIRIQRKAQLIRSIQEAEHNIPCFGVQDNCNEVKCIWLDDCRKENERSINYIV